jgi:glycosyltransferase involved in cell wall biosynthesis
MDARSVWAVLSYPPNRHHPNGFSPRWHSFLEAVGKRWPLDVLALHRNPTDWDEKSFLPERFPVCHFWCDKIAPHIIHQSGVSRLRRAISLVAPSLPAMSHPARLPNMRRRLGEHAPKLALLFLPQHAHFGFQFPRSTRCIYVLEEATDRVDTWSLQNVPSAIRDWVARHEKDKVRRLYRRVADTGNPVVVISDQEKDYFSAFIPRERITVIPHALDCEYFEPVAAPEDIDVAVIAYLGHERNFRPALEAYHSLEKRWPSGKARPRWAFVGKDPHPSVTALASSGVMVTGQVADVRPYYARAKVILVPARAGSGTKTTVLQAWAMRRATVASNFSLAGLPARPGENLLAGASTEELVGGIEALLSSSALRDRISVAGLETVRRERDIRVVSATFLQLCEETLARGNRPSAVER